MAKAPEPVSGRSRASGSTSPGKPSGPVMGERTPTIRSSPPEARSIPTAARMATR